MNKEPFTPDWANIPEQYNWVAIEQDGEILAYNNKPMCYVKGEPMGQWYSPAAEMCHLGYIKKVKDDSWREMIYERPKQ